MDTHRHRNRSVLIITIALLVVGVLGFTFFRATLPPKTSTPPNAPEARATPTVSSTQGLHRVGEVVSIGSWDITIHAVNIARSPNTTHSASLLIDMTVKNTASTEQAFSPSTQCLLRDQSGQTYSTTQMAFPPTAPHETIPTGAAPRGTLVFIIPDNQQSFTFVFKPTSQATQQAQWNLGA